MRRRAEEVTVPQLPVSRVQRPEPAAVAAAPRSDLIFFNGMGGFTPDGREYIITITEREMTPTPWVNVLANSNFGTVISESGLAYTWSENAHEFRLTPWSNDPVSDSSGEAFYIRDEDTGHFWSPTPMPRPRRVTLHHPARIRLQRLRAHRGRHPLRDVGLCGRRRRRQVYGVESAK